MFMYKKSKTQYIQRKGVTMFSVAILQGRLSPDPEKKFQFFPPHWHDEFKIAKSVGVAGIEWLVAPQFFEMNPIFDRSWEEEVRNIEHQTGILVTSICADWYMEHAPWHMERKYQYLLLKRIFEAAYNTKHKCVLIPLLEQHSIQDPVFQALTREVFKPLIPLLERKGVTIAFETELERNALMSFVDSFESSQVGVYYDIGNCTSYGFDCAEDIRVLGNRIKGVHVKDRRKHSSQSLLLGTGDADIRGCLKALQEVSFKGSLVLQAWRGEDYLADAHSQYMFLTSLAQEVCDEG